MVWSSAIIPPPQTKHLIPDRSIVIPPVAVFVYSMKPAWFFQAEENENVINKYALSGFHSEALAVSEEMPSGL